MSVTLGVHTTQEGIPALLETSQSPVDDAGRDDDDDDDNGPLMMVVMMVTMMMSRGCSEQDLSTLRESEAQLGLCNVTTNEHRKEIVIIFG